MSEQIENFDSEDLDNLDSNDSESFDVFGTPTLAIGNIVIPAPDKYQAGHVMTDEEAIHYSNFVRGRCQSNMISLEKRGKATWNETNAAEFYATYVPGSPRGRGPSLEEIHDEALELLLVELAEKQGASVPRSKEKRAEFKARVDASPKMQTRIQELEAQVLESYRNKAREESKAKVATLDLDSLL